MARGGFTTKTRSSRRFFGDGARGIHHEDTKFTKIFWGWRAGDLPRRHEGHEVFVGAGFGGWWLVVGGWWLVVGGWWLVVGGWWLPSNLLSVFSV
jgi:hypothetical protein